jgi:hypothetical protein
MLPRGLEPADPFRTGKTAQDAALPKPRRSNTFPKKAGSRNMARTGWR